MTSSAETAIDELLAHAMNTPLHKRRECMETLERLGPNAAKAIPFVLDTIRQTIAKLHTVYLQNAEEGRIWSFCGRNGPFTGSEVDEYWVLRPAYRALFALNPNKGAVNEFLKILAGWTFAPNHRMTSTQLIAGYKIPRYSEFCLCDAGLQSWVGRAKEILASENTPADRIERPQQSPYGSPAAGSPSGGA